MIKIRQKDSTSYPINFLMVDSTDHITGKTGLTPTVTLSKNGAAFGAAAGAVTEIANGWYSLAGNATDRNTLGELLVHATASGADQFDIQYAIVAYDPFAGVTTLGAGATAKTYTVTDGTNPIADVDVWVTTDIAGNSVVASGKSNSSGQVVFYLDSGVTYYIWRQKDGYNFTNPDTEVA